MNVGDRNFGGRNQEEIVAGGAVEIVLELGQLAGAGERGPIDQVRRLDLEIAVLARVEVEQEIRQRAHQSRARSR